jgi:hypothetical protein
LAGIGKKTSRTQDFLLVLAFWAWSLYCIEEEKSKKLGISFHR